MHPAEQDLLGAAIMAPELTQTIRLQPDDFADPRAGAIWQAIGEIHRAGRQPDPILIVDEARRYGVTVDHHLVVDLVGCGLAANATVYAERIADAASRRRLKEAMTRAAQQLNEGDPVEAVLGELVHRFDASTPLEAEVARAMTLAEFIGQDLPPTTWVIPDLLATGDRLVLTGMEGLGKTVLMRQVGVACAAGRHPFTMDAMPPRRVLFVDCENPLGIMVKSLSSITRPFRQQGIDFGDRMWIQRYPQGLDLASPRDRLALHALCRTFRPDLLLIGPAYKLYVGGAGAREEDLARQVTSVLDGLREEFGFALILEHHSPHGQAGMARNVRPIGSSLWLRWPEFGFGLARPDDGDSDVRAADVIPWRGSRDQRDWPRRLVQGTGVPWVAADTPGY